MRERVRICEVGPRDGLQNEKRIVAAAGKIALIDSLSDTGLDYIECTSFVSARAVPQMADAADVMAGITRREGVTYAALTPNLRGFEAALAAGVDEVAVFASASETFSTRNINCTIGESLERYRAVCAEAARNGIPVRGYVSCVVACPYEGRVAPDKVGVVSEALLAMGCREISLGDTIGAAQAGDVSRLLEVLCRTIAPQRLAGHFHDTRGHALAGVREALDHGLRTFDSAVGGAGGCPFAPGAPGNLATERLAQMLAGSGYDTGIDMDKLDAASGMLNTLLRRAA
jgi:hydroxymethylglutaryl-CoA lyase